MAQFRASARTVDMLGRQQIAGVSTAVSELFKNAHDAYATSATADLVRPDDLFVLRDDGLGMSRREFEERWLTLGTSAKTRPEGLPPPPTGMRPRPALGEKGIGRLAIATIGPQVLVLTRAGGSSEELTAALIHWGAFEIPDVSLGDIEVPIAEYKPGTTPDTSDLAHRLERALSKLPVSQSSSGLVQKIKEDLSLWEQIDLQQIAFEIDAETLVGDSGTCFVITPTSPDLSADLLPASPKEAPPLLRTLIGFANTMTPGHAPPALSTSFRDHRDRDLVADLIEDSEFFTPEEFTQADHHFSGEFDAFGQFTGTVSVFGGEPVAFPLAWTGARGEPTHCGPFALDIAYVQGLERQSRLDREEWFRMTDKLDRYGGLYIYRDGIRVLPYGDNRFDWLDIELRRNKSASDAYFSYRRMFGAVRISRAWNADLREKAGREGFSGNTAYRQFRSVLEQFLIQVANEFFREGGGRTDTYEAGRTANERLDKARRVRRTRVTERRKQLRLDLAGFFQMIDEEVPQQRARATLEELAAAVRDAQARPSVGEAAEALARAERTARERVGHLTRELEVTRPRGVGLPGDLAREYASYEREKGRIGEEVVAPAFEQVEGLISSVSGEQESALQRRLRLDGSLDSVRSTGTSDVAGAKKELRGAAKETDQRAVKLGQDSTVRLETEVQDVLARAARLDVVDMPVNEFVAQRAALEERVRSTVDQQTAALRDVSDQLKAISWPVNGDGPLVSEADQVEDLETRLETFLERAEQDLELTQLGLAVDIVNHEFQASIRTIRQSLRRLKPWADENPELSAINRNLRTSFDHLDSYLRLFTPLHRRLYRRPVEISGSDIYRYVNDLFSERLKSDATELLATPDFERASVLMFPSTLYPVFVNLVDNAIYWLRDYVGQRTVTLDADKGDLTVTDSGRGPLERDRDAIFEMGFTRKPSGTGYGLYISREVLRREGLDLMLDRSDPDRGARFRIKVGEG